MKSIKHLTILLLVVLGLEAQAQIRIKELHRQSMQGLQDSVFLGVSRTRSLIKLAGQWMLYQPGEREKASYVSVPSNYKGETDLVYEKSIELSAYQVENYKLQLAFLGISYSAEISINGYGIYKHPGGEFPFKVDLPRDILKKDRKNILTIKLTHRLGSDITIPTKQRFLFPESIGGIIRDVYILRIPKISITQLDFNASLQGVYRARLSVNAKISTLMGQRTDTSKNNLYSIRTVLVSPEGGEALNSSSGVFSLDARKERQISQVYDISNPALWTPQRPQSYFMRVQLFRGDQLIDEIDKSLAVYSLAAGADSLLFNGKGFSFNGAAYLLSNRDYGNMISFGRMREDLKIIKELGFNAVRFSKSAPHPYMLKVCQEIGLLALIELPINSIPEQICIKGSFRDRAKTYLGQFLAGYKDFSAVAAIGLGSTYLSNSTDHAQFIGELAAYSKGIINRPVFASFVGFDFVNSTGLDFYGIEILNKQIEELIPAYTRAEALLGRGKVFLSEVTYSTFMKSTTGYLNAYSYEAQAKFFSDLLDFSRSNGTSGYFLNSIFNYRGDFSSLMAGYDPDNVYSIGILGEDRGLNSLSYKVIQSKLSDGEKVTIPIGNKKDDTPIMLIVFGLVLGLLMGLLVNSKRKFREDASRALLRPYNFYADVRDQRILSGFHSNSLMLILAGSSALLLTNLLYYLRANVFFEKALLAFGSRKIMYAFSYLAWNPLEAIGWLTLASAVVFILISIIVKIASLFIRNKVFYSNIFAVVVWSFLPLILLLPVGLVLYKILNSEAVNIYIFALLVIVNIWIFYRLMKGIYVIFDVNPGRVYMYSILLIAVSVLGVLIYYQITDSSVYYLLNAYQQYKIM